MPLVSIIIPTYNNEKTIERAINSVLNQSFDDIEVIVINDGSKDNTKNIIEKMKSEKILLINQDNKERSYSRNRGLKLAKGKYIGFLDADDEYLPDKINNEVNFLKNNLNYSMVYSNTYYEVDGKLIKTRYKKINNIKFPKIIKYLNYFHTLNVLIRKEVFDNFEFDKNMNINEDWDIWIKISKNYNIGYLNETNSIIHKEKNKKIEYYSNKKNKLYLMNKILDNNKLSLYYYNYIRSKFLYDICTRNHKQKIIDKEFFTYYKITVKSLLITFQFIKVIKISGLLIILSFRR